MSLRDDLADAEEYSNDDVVAVLYRQHADITDALNRVSDSRGDERAAHFAAVAAFMKRHEAAEQQLIRPIIKAAGRGYEADQRNAEEHLADGMIAALCGFDVDSGEFQAQFAQLKHAVASHGEAEETFEFPILEASRSELERIELGRQFLQAQAE